VSPVVEAAGESVPLLAVGLCQLSPSGDEKRRERGVGGLVQMAGLLT